MRYLTSISLALIVLMALACTAEPATPTREVRATIVPTPTKPPIWSKNDFATVVADVMNRPTLSESDALVIVKDHLGLKPVNHTNCLDFLAQSGNLDDIKWKAIFVPSERKAFKGSFWKVTVEGATNREGNASTAQPDSSGPYIGEYELYEETRSVVALTLPC